MRARHLLVAAALGGLSIAAWAAGADLGQAQKQATNWTAISMFGMFVLGTLWITKWAAAKTQSAADFDTAGGGITGFQNGLAIAGAYMSAASFLGISAAVMASGFDGLIFSIGFLVGWPVVTFLLAERLRNLGRFTFADVAAFRFAQTPLRLFAASGTRVVDAFHLIAQMVGAGQLIKMLFGVEYWIAVVIVGALMMVYVLFGGMTATTWVQIIKACLLLAGATFMAFMVLPSFGFSPEAMFATAVEIETQLAVDAGKTPDEAARQGFSIMGPGGFMKDPISAISFGMALVFGTAGLPHILMRFFTVPNAKQARKSVAWATTWIGYFCISDQPGLPRRQGRAARRQQHGRGAPGQRGGRQRVPGLHLGGGVRDDPRRRRRADAVGCVGGVARPLRHRDQEGAGAQQGRVARREDHHRRDRPRRRRARHRVREAEHRVHGQPGVRDRGVGQRPGAADERAVEGLHDARRRDRRLPRPDLVRGADGGLAAVWEATLGNPKGSALFPHASPALFSMTIGVLGIRTFSLLDGSARGWQDRAGFLAQQVRSETGIGAAIASGH